MSIKSILSKVYRLFYPLSPVEMYRRMGVKIGEGTNIQNDVIIDYSHYWHVTIGKNVTLAPRVHILAHDASTKFHIGYTRIGKVEIGDNVFVGAGTIIMPGTVIGENSIVGAGSLVSKDIPPNTVALGSPAEEHCSIEEFVDKNKEQMSFYPLFQEEYTTRQNVSHEMMNEMNEEMKDRFGYVR